MTLKNLLGISLDAVAPDRILIAKLLAAAHRNIEDARLPALSAENRCDLHRELRGKYLRFYAATKDGLINTR